METIEYTAYVSETSFSIHSTVHVSGQIEDWVVFAGVLPADRYAISELRILPAEERHPGNGRVPFPNMDNRRGTWSGRPDFVPSGGIPFRILRQIRKREIQQAAREWMDRVGRQLAEAGGDHHGYRRVADAAARNEA